MKKISRQSGFTLVETMIYVALFAIIMAGAIVSIYGIIGSSARNQTKAMAEEEGSFLLGKIDWVLTGVVIQSGTSSISMPAAGAGSSASGNTLSLKKSDDGSTLITVSIGLDAAGKNFEISRDGGAAETLNNSNIWITCPAAGCFTHTASSGDGITEESVTADFTVNTQTSEGLSYSQEFSTIKYLRK